MTQAWWLGKQAMGASVTRICEVGFNAGYSALAMLMSARLEATLIAFDIATKSYTASCANFLGQIFVDRFALVAGPSNETVPRYALEHSMTPRCDVIFIDGGHSEE